MSGAGEAGLSEAHGGDAHGGEARGGAAPAGGAAAGAADEGEAAFEPGAAVRVRDDWPELRGPAHVRTPHYLRGRRGRVVRLLGRFPNPEDLAFARPAPRLPLYHVAFRPQDVWADAGGEELLVEVFGHWLEAA